MRMCSNCAMLPVCVVLTSMSALLMALQLPNSGVSAIAIAGMPTLAVNETTNNSIEDDQQRATTTTTIATAIKQKEYAEARVIASGVSVGADKSAGGVGGSDDSSTDATDVYVQRNQQQCFATHSLASCVKYKVAKVLWRLATNALGYFPHEHSRDLSADKRRVRFVQLAEPADEALQMFSNARSFRSDSEWTAAVKFVQRSLETFGRNHGLQLMLGGDTGARISSNEVEEPRLKKKKQKWLIILPLIILMKIAHLKMTVVTLMLGVLGLNVVLVGGTAWLIHYLKFKTLCKIHPHLVQSHSHVYDSDPAEYSTFVGSGHTGAHYGSPSYGSHEAGIHGWANKDWSSSKAYSAHSNNNYLDTISKRLQ